MNSSEGLCSTETPRHHCKFKNPTRSFRRRRYRPPETPLSNWKLEDHPRTFAGGDAVVSARKLAAGLWNLRPAGGGVKCRSCDRLKFQNHNGHVNIKLPLHHTVREFGIQNKDQLRTPKHLCVPKHEIPHDKSTMEGVTKWDGKCSKKCINTFYFYSSTIIALQKELNQARIRILKLEDKHRSSKKKFQNMTRELMEEKSSREIKEHLEVNAAIHELKDELHQERRKRKKIEIFSFKLLNNLDDAHSTMKQLVQDYEEEKNARELMEEACNELAKKVGEDKVKLEALMRETTKRCEEMEEERRMLHLAEYWREERVHMKLLDAKLAVEDKYSEMNKLVSKLECMLKAGILNEHVMDVRKADLIKQAAKSVNVGDIKEFEYSPPKSDDIFSVFEELQQVEANTREIKPLSDYNLVEDASNEKTPSFDANVFGNNYMPVNSNGVIASKNGFMEHGNGNICKNSRIATMDRTDYSEIAGWNSPDTEISEVCPISVEQSKRKEYSVSRVRSLPKNIEYCKMTSDENDRRLSNHTFSSVRTNSPNKKLVENGYTQWPSVGRLVSPNSGNPHIAKGIKGSVEWPRDNQKNCVKKKLFKDTVKSQRTQLRYRVK